jgi:endonuclease/exonuclease/phosphatase (EEP) superfamily protein YafD
MSLMEEELAAPAEAEQQPVPRWRRIARVLRRVYGWIVIILCVLWLVYNVVRRVVDGRWAWSILLDSVPPLLLVLLPLLLTGLSALACGTRRRIAVAVAIAGLLPGLDETGVNWHALTADQTVPAGAVHVFTWNTNYWGMSNKDPEAQYRFMRAQNADVYLLQEHVIWVPGTAEVGYYRIDDDAKLAQEFPGYHIARRSELLTISRFPILSTPLFGPAARLAAGVPFNQVFARDKVLRTDLDINGKVLSVYNIHVTVQTAIDLSFFGGDMDLNAYYERKFRWRAEEMQGLVDDMRTNPNPQLVSGDFNSTSAMVNLDELKSIADDATVHSRQLLPLSWRFDSPMNFQWDSPLAGLPLPFWRIDWTFTRGAVRVHKYELVSSRTLSDHRPQETWLTLP